MMKNQMLSQLAKQAAILHIARPLPEDAYDKGKQLLELNRFKGVSRLSNTFLVRLPAAGTNFTIGNIPAHDWKLALRYADMAILHFAKYRIRGEVSRLSDATISHPGVFNLGEKNARQDYAECFNVVAHLEKIEQNLREAGALTLLAERAERRFTMKNAEEILKRIENLEQIVADLKGASNEIH